MNLVGTLHIFGAQYLYEGGLQNSWWNVSCDGRHTPQPVDQLILSAREHAFWLILVLKATINTHLD